MNQTVRKLSAPRRKFLENVRDHGTPWHGLSGPELKKVDRVIHWAILRGVVEFAADNRPWPWRLTERGRAWAEALKAEGGHGRLPATGTGGRRRG